MRDWNVIVTIQDRRFKTAFDVLEPLGETRRTNYYNVLAMKVADVRAFLDTLRDWMENYPETRETISRVGAVFETFEFHSLEEFASRSQEAASHYLDALVGKRFYVRIHRRGWKGRIDTTQHERRLGAVLWEELQKCSPPARVDFQDPDAILAIETLDNRGGIALWTRADRERYPFLNLD